MNKNMQLLNYNQLKKTASNWKNDADFAERIFFGC